MKYIILIIGGLFLIGSTISIGKYVFDYGELSQYGKGFIWGKIFLFIIGLLLIYFGLKKPKKTSP
jgi:hypothetical protein